MIDEEILFEFDSELNRCFRVARFRSPASMLAKLLRGWLLFIALAMLIERWYLLRTSEVSVLYVWLSYHSYYLIYHIMNTVVTLLRTYFPISLTSGFSSSAHQKHEVISLESARRKLASAFSLWHFVLFWPRNQHSGASKSTWKNTQWRRLQFDTGKTSSAYRTRTRSVKPRSWDSFSLLPESRWGEQLLTIAQAL